MGFYFVTIILVLIASLIAQSQGASCPHRTFVAKHILNGGTDSEGAAENFASNAHVGRQTYGTAHAEVNTVFYVDRKIPMTYVEVAGNRCRFSRPATKYNCQYDRTGRVWKWKCTGNGQAYAEHDKIRGHLF